MTPWRPLPTRILQAAAQHATRPALKTHDGELTHAELISAAARLATAIADRCRAGDRVAIVTGDCQLTYTAWLAIWLAGCAYVPLNRENPAARCESILRDAGARLILSGTHHEAAAEAARRTGVDYVVPSLDDLPARPHDPAEPGPGDLASILFTSGSTGQPKGVPITHGNLAAFVDAWSADPGCQLSADDRVLQMFELSFDLSVASFFVPLAAGASVHVVPARGVYYLNIARVIQASEITFVLAVPSLLTYLHRFFDELRLPALRHSMFCGEALLQPLVEGWSTCAPNARIQNSYGPTEATVFCTIYDWTRERARAEAHNDIVPIGGPLGGTEALILDEQANPVNTGERGELCLRGPQVMAGYWNNPDKTEAAFVWPRNGADRARAAYRTGDIVSQAADGCLLWHMRKDFQVKIDGHRIELGEIEAHARQIANTPAVAVVTRHDEAGHAELALFFEGGTCSDEELGRALAEVLPAYMQPKFIRRLQSLPLNRSSKVDRQQLSRRPL